MSQYSAGAVNVVLSDATVTGVGTLFLATVAAADWFSIDESGVMYQVGSVTDDTHLELTSNYAGATASAQAYWILRDFTDVNGFPLMSKGDSDTPTIYNRLVAMLEEKLTPRTNFSVASQAPAAATRVYITGSALTIPPDRLQIGTILRWKFNMTKTAAGTAASTFDVCFGTAGTTADTARVSFTKPAGTAAADEGYVEIECVVRGPLSASGIVVGTFKLTHNLENTGHAVIPSVVVNTVSGTFDVTAAGLIAGVCITSGASDAITIQQVTAEAVNV